MKKLERQAARTTPLQRAGGTSYWSILLGSLVAVLAFAPFWVANFLPPLAGLVIACALVVASELVRAESRATSTWILLIVGTWGALVGLIWLALQPTNEVAVSTLQNYLILAPLALIAGALIAGSKSSKSYIVGWQLISLALVPLAIFEYLTTTSLFGRNYLYFLSEYGTGRALLMADHPIILGVLWVVGIALLSFTRMKIRVPLALAFFAGILSTGSAGPIAVGAMALLVVMFPKLLAYVGRRGKAVGALLTLGIAVAAYPSLTVWEPKIAGATIDAYSTGYRPALYSLVPDILAHVPFGYGIEGIPRGVWYLDSSRAGARDIALTVDSELVYIVLIFGWAGLAAFLGLLVIALRCLKTSPELSLTLFCLVACGLTVALTAWSTMTAVLVLVVGATLRQLRRPNDTQSANSP